MTTIKFNNFTTSHPTAIIEVCEWLHHFGIPTNNTKIVSSTSNSLIMDIHGVSLEYSPIFDISSTYDNYNN